MPDSFMHHITINGTNFEIQDKEARENTDLLHKSLLQSGSAINDTLVDVLSYPLLPLEIGAINITTGGWVWIDNKKRVRTPEGNEFHIYKGDVIKLTDYTNARMYIGIREDDGTYRSRGWLTNDYICQYEGYCVLLISRINGEVVLDSAGELADLVRIERLTTLQNELRTESEKVTKIGTDLIETAQHLSYAEVPFEFGSVSMIDSTTIQYNNSDRNIRIAENIGGIHLRFGDVIGLSSYEYAKYQLFYYANGTYKSLSTLNADYTVQEAGLYFINILTKNADIIYYLNEYAELFFVNRAELTEYVQYPYDVHPIHGINHRGMQYEAPENTLPAFRLSVEAGYHFVETDVQFTKNDVPVLLHDPTLNRTARNSDGTALSETVYIKNITYEEALAYDFSVVNGTYDSTYDGNKIMKFEDFIIFCKRTELFPYLELKSETIYTQAQVNILIDMLTKYNFLRNVSWISWSDEYLRLIVNADKGARVGRIKNSEISGASVKALNEFKTGYNRVFWSVTPYSNDTWKITEQSIINAKNANQGLSIGVISTVDGMVNVLNHFENSGYISGCLCNGRINFADVTKRIALGTLDS